MLKLTIIIVLAAIRWPSVVEQHIAGTQDRLERARWIISAQDHARHHGLDADSATFRLLQPAADFLAADFRLNSDPSSTPRYNFVGAERAYADVGYVPVNGVEWGKRSPVSLQTLFSKSLVCVARAVPVPRTREYDVEIEFGQEGLDALASLLGAPDPTDSYVDWYCKGHRAGEPISEMRAVVTSQNRALVPFSVNEVVGQRMVDRPIVIAKNLTREAAERLVRCLGF